MEISATASVNHFAVLHKRISRFLRIGVLLHLTAMGGGVLFFWFGQLSLTALEPQEYLFFVGYGLMACYGFILSFFAELDAFSRYQNYKKVKDLFHENGFQTRIVNQFIGSRCQRDAIKVAAGDLGLMDKLCRYYDHLGYRWYHLLPGFIFSKPQVFFTGRYWKKTLFEKKYKSKYFLW